MLENLAWVTSYSRRKIRDLEKSETPPAADFSCESIKNRLIKLSKLSETRPGQSSVLGVWESKKIKMSELSETRPGQSSVLGVWESKKNTGADYKNETGKDCLEFFRPQRIKKTDATQYTVHSTYIHVCAKGKGE